MKKWESLATDTKGMFGGKKEKHLVKRRGCLTCSGVVWQLVAQEPLHR